MLGAPEEVDVECVANMVSSRWFNCTALLNPT
jgi:hypothetical protein